MFITEKKLAALLGVVLFIGAAGGFFWKYYPHSNQAAKVKRGPSVEAGDINIDKIIGMDNLVPFLVLGSGPASLAAALYGARTRIRTVVLKGNQPGGQLTGTSYIENWPAIRKIRGAEVVKDFEIQAARFGAIMVSDAAVSIDLSSWPYTVKTEEGKTLHALSLFVGTGATPKKLNVPGESEYWGHGVTTCAICDAPYHKGDTVVVIGGGDSAVEECLELSAYAREVRMLVRGSVMRASPAMAERLKQCSNVKVMYNYAVTKIHGVDGHVSGVDIVNTETKARDFWENVRGVFLAIGHSPNSHMVKDYVQTDSMGYVTLKGRTQETSLAGVFAAGDVSDPRYKQAGVAAGDGIKAGLDAMWWLSDIGFNGQVAQKLEPFFFDPQLDNKIEVESITSTGVLDEYIEDIGSEKLIVLDFYASTCPSCMHMLPVVQWAATKLSEKAVFFKVDAAIAFDIVKRYNAPSVPHFVVLKRGKVVGRTSDVMDRTQLYDFMKQFTDK